MSLNLSSVEKRLVITVFFCMSFTIANLITVKIIDLSFLGLMVPAGVLIYPLVYVLTNVITEVYGERAARRTLVLGIAADVLFVFMTTLLLFLPSPANYTGDSSLAFVFTQTPKILIASYISYLIGNLVNARLTVIVNRGDSHIGLRNLFAIAMGELVDNIIFIGLAFIGEVPVMEIAIMIFSHWVLSLIWISIAEPFTMCVVRWAKRDDAIEGSNDTTVA
ncbi:queuosine precursor transporter [uncultured Methanosphaera sp.]|uniref:queuosine precursor transporter n=1 Tax=uncultured Methanosphaera sp. TaxID=262501 RepID=UPI00280A7C7D|nr:queuosine precursor transporter [uncultured Methanosphaera sp.]